MTLLNNLFKIGCHLLYADVTSFFVIRKLIKLIIKIANTEQF